MNTPTILAAALALFVTGAIHAKEPDPPGDHPSSPAAATPQEGGLGKKAVEDEAKAGAPGNLLPPAQENVMTGHDLDADGHINKAEAAKIGDLATRFDTFDANHDGKLDGTEFRQFTLQRIGGDRTAPPAAKEAEVKKKHD